MVGTRRKWNGSTYSCIQFVLARRYQSTERSSTLRTVRNVTLCYVATLTSVSSHSMYSQTSHHHQAADGGKVLFLPSLLCILPALPCVMVRMTRHPAGQRDESLEETIRNGTKQPVACDMEWRTLSHPLANTIRPSCLLVSSVYSNIWFMVKMVASSWSEWQARTILNEIVRASPPDM